MRDHGCILLRNAMAPTAVGNIHEVIVSLFETDRNDYGKGNLVRERGWCNASWFGAKH